MWVRPVTLGDVMVHDYGGAVDPTIVVLRVRFYIYYANANVYFLQHCMFRTCILTYLVELRIVIAVVKMSLNVILEV